MVWQSGTFSEMKQKQSITERDCLIHWIQFFSRPQGKARIRVQISAAHTEEEIDQVIEAFVEVG
jgi:7-keto-8-aminopelargonate synthetase-like enzyme